METKIDVYDLIINEDWNNAIINAKNNYAKSSNTIDLMNIFPALLMKGDYNEVLNIVNEIWKSNKKENDNEYIWSAIAHIGLGNIDKSLSLLEQTRDCKFSDPTGGIQVESLIYCISQVFNQESNLKESLKRLKILIKRKNIIDTWPAPIGFLITENIEFENVLQYRDDIKPIYNKQSCQAYFYYGILILKQDITESLKFLEKCNDFTPQSYFKYEYFFADVIKKHIKNNLIS